MEGPVMQLRLIFLRCQVVEEGARRASRFHLGWREQVWIGQGRFVLPPRVQVTAIKAASYPRSASLIYFRDSTLSEISQRSLQPKAIRYQERSTSICSQKQRRPFCYWPLWPQHISPSNTLKCEAIPSQMVLLSGSIHVRPAFLPFIISTLIPIGANVNQTAQTNRTLWPLTGGSVNADLHHPWTYLFINLGLGTTYPAFNLSLTRQLLNVTGNGTFCLPQLTLPAGVSVSDGQNASIQVVTVGQSGSALYNVRIL